MRSAAAVDRLLAGDTRAIARTISLLEQEGGPGELLLQAVRERAAARAAPVGLTGAPGAGKSTLVNALTVAARRRGRRVAIVAVDPTSSRSGGAFLGDRIRMLDLVMDGGVYMRSIGSRGDVGGLSLATGRIVDLLSRLPFDEVLVESVGVGQLEPEVHGVVDTTVVVVAPGGGDDIQVQKAGTSEGADVFAVNKADLAGAETLARCLEQSVAMGRSGTWAPPVVRTVGHEVATVAPLWSAIEDHRAHLASAVLADGSQLRRARARVAETVAAAARTWAVARLQADADLDARLRAGEPASSIARDMVRRLTAAAGGRTADVVRGNPRSAPRRGTSVGDADAGAGPGAERGLADEPDERSPR